MGAAGRAGGPGCRSRGEEGGRAGDEIGAVRGRAHPQVQCFPKRTLGTQHLVVLSTLTYYSKKIQRKRHLREARQELPESPSRGVTRSVLSSPSCALW